MADTIGREGKGAGVAPSSAKKDSFHDFCEKSIYAALVLLLPLLAASILALSMRTSYNFTLSGLRVSAQPADLFFVVATFFMEFTLAQFYRYVLPFANEPLSSRFLSGALVVYIYTTNLLLGMPEFFPYRFFLIAGVLGVVAIMDRNLAKRFDKTPFEPRTRFWYTNVRWTVLATIVGAVLFAVLMDAQLRTALFRRLFVQGQFVQVKDAYFLYVPILFYLVYLFTAIRSCWRNVRYFEEYAEKEAKWINRASSRKASP